MIAYLKGVVAAKAEKSCLLVTPGGVGYEVGLSTPTVAALPAEGGEAELWTQTIVREDAMELYGFLSWRERQTFAMLLGISKLGPKTALGILSTFSADDLVALVAHEDVDALTRVPGIGKKSAQRIFVELKYKLDAEAAAAPPRGLEGAAVSAFRDALAGLTNLGYDETQAREVLDEVFAAEPDPEPDLDVTQALRSALKLIAKRRQ